MPRSRTVRRVPGGAPQASPSSAGARRGGSPESPVKAIAPSVLLAVGLQVGCDARAADPAPQRRNVVMVSIDTMRADRLGRVGRDGRSLTPALDAFGQDARVWTRAFSPSNETLFSHAGVFLGGLPSAVGPLDYRTFRLPPDAPTLAARFARAGWVTEAVVAGGHLDPVLGVGAGFQRYATSNQGFSSFAVTVPAALERLDALAAQERPFLLFVHGYDCHSPYIKPGPLHHPETPGYDGPLRDLAANPLTWERIHDGAYYPRFRPPDLQTADLAALDPRIFASLEDWAARPDVDRVPLDDADRAFVTGAYDASVAYADSQVGRLLRRVDELGIGEDTVVVVFSDHGEDLLEHGFVNHRATLHDSNTQVLWMARAPGLDPGIDDEVVSLASLPDLVLRLSGAAPDAPLPVPGVAVSESMLGEVSVRTAAGRLRVPRAALSGPRPAAPGEGMELLDDAGQPLPWSSPVGTTLWDRLVEEAG